MLKLLQRSAKHLTTSTPQLRHLLYFKIYLQENQQKYVLAELLVDLISTNGMYKDLVLPPRAVLSAREHSDMAGTRPSNTPIRLHAVPDLASSSWSLM